MIKQSISRHISQGFNQALLEIHSNVLAMGGLVEKNVGDAVTAVVTGDTRLGEAAARADDQVNAMEVAIDDECSRILARRQPAAGDLRLVVVVIKTITDLERIGDEAQKIARIAASLHISGRLRAQLGAIRQMSEDVRRMLRGALDAFARMDANAALATMRMDDQVDRCYDEILRRLIERMVDDPQAIGQALEVMWCARALERVGDHAKNIGEYVIYMVHGKDVRHTPLAEIERVTEMAPS